MREDRIVLYAEIPDQKCSRCGEVLLHEFVPTRSKPVVFANDSKYPAWAKGPKQMARYARDHSLVAVGDAKPDEVSASCAKQLAHNQAKFEAETGKAIDSVLEELGDELYTSEPQPETAGIPDPDLTGAGILD